LHELAQPIAVVSVIEGKPYPPHPEEPLRRRSPWLQAFPWVTQVAHVADSPLVNASQSRWHAEGSIIAQAVTADGLQATRHLSE
jgi:hypothetical protein